jgi:hypothetical protein
MGTQLTRGEAWGTAPFFELPFDKAIQGLRSQALGMFVQSSLQLRDDGT